MAAAVHAFNRLTPVINEQTDNALMVNGYEVLVYNRLKSGIRCSCCGGDFKQSILGEDGAADPVTMQEILQGGTFGFGDYAAGDPGASRDPKHNILTTGNDRLADRQEHKNGEADFDANGYQNAMGRDNGLDPNMEFPLNPFSEGHLIGCPVCYGTGFQGGFSAANSWRYVASTVTPDVMIVGGEITSEHKPTEFLLYSSDSYIEFSVRLPAGAYLVDSLRVCHGVNHLSTQVQLQIYDQGSWFMLTPQLFLELSDGTVRRFRVQSLDDDVRVTHVELQLGLSNRPLLVEFPKLVESADTSILEALQDVELQCSPRIPQLRPFDVLADMNNSRLWMVREVTRSDNNARASGRTGYGLQASARIVQSNEIWSTLPVRRSSRSDTRHRVGSYGALSAPPR